MKKQILAAVSIICVLSFGASFVTARFTDVPGHWTQAAIAVWADYGIINGYDGKFDPDGQLTRAQIATILSNMLGLTQKSENIYADVADADWFSDAVLKCAYAGIMRGDGQSANPGAPVTLEAVMVMLARALNIEGSYNIQRQFLDLADISDWARNQVYAMVNKGYVNGSPELTLNSQSNISRAETVTILNNAVKMYINEPGEYAVENDFEGIIVLKGDGITLKTDNNSLNVVIAKEYSYTLVTSGDESITPTATTVPGGNGGIAGVRPDNAVTVTFFDVPGSVFDVQKTVRGGGVKPNGSPTRTGYIFDGWDKPFTTVPNDLTVNSKWVDTSIYDNLFALPTAYLEKGEKTSLSLSLCGKVDLCAFDIAITYDNGKLEFIEYTGADEDVLINYNAETETIHLNFVSGKNISGEIDICNLVFRAIGDTGDFSPVAIEIKEIIKLSADGGFLTPTREKHAGTVTIF